MTSWSMADAAPMLTVHQVGKVTVSPARSPTRRPSEKTVDSDNDTVTYTATQPFCGTVTDLGNGLFQYTTNAQAVGGFIDRFAVTADDGRGGVVTKTVALGV